MSVEPGIEEFYDRLRAQIVDALRSDPVLGRLKKTAAEYRSAARTMADPHHQLAKMAMVERQLGTRLRGKDLLEIGSGVGDFVVTCRREGVAAVGVEPHGNNSGDLKAIADQLLAFFGMGPSVIQSASGESLPFEANSFDVVFSYYVLEHVRDPVRVLTESIRVLRRGGLLLFVFPNYGSCWEGHYGILWLPRASRSLGRLWVRLCGLDPSYLDTLQLIDLAAVRRLLETVGESAEVVSLGEETFVREVRSLEFTGAGSLEKARSFLAPLRRIGLLPLIARLAARCGMYTPFYLVLRKRL
jgi:SAM-dependent methyltransferase